MITAHDKLLAYGLGSWGHGLLLITPALFELLPDDFTLVSIFGASITKAELTDTDTRAGYMGYGVLTDRQKGDLALLLKLG